jgi:hypothetical protein
MHEASGVAILRKAELRFRTNSKIFDSLVTRLRGHSWVSKYRRLCMALHRFRQVGDLAFYRYINDSATNSAAGDASATKKTTLRSPSSNRRRRHDLSLVGGGLRIASFATR